METKSATLDASEPHDDSTSLRSRPEPVCLPRLLYFGEVPVESSYHGSALLYRLLQSYPCSNLRVLERSGRRSDTKRRLPGVRYDSVPASWTFGARTLRTRLQFLYWPVWNALARLWASRAKSRLAGFSPEAILTVHEGTVWLAAYALAEKLKIPCHLVVHDDWFREMPPGWLRRRLEKKFTGIYRSVATRFCISPYMEDSFRLAYGTGGDVLYPSRASDVEVFSAPPTRSGYPPRPFTVAYGGTAFDGGHLEALGSIAQALQRRGSRLLLFGPISQTDLDGTSLGRPNVTYGGLLTSAELIARFRAEADALLIPMSFARQDRGNMTVNFPSKLADYTAAGLPLLIYGPSYSSAVKWGRDNPDCCVIVDRDDRSLLLSAIDRLQNDARYRAELGANALLVGAKYFSHGGAQALFFSRILGCAGATETREVVGE